MRKVYIVNKGGHDFDAARKFGELVYISEGSIPALHTNNMYRLAVEAMKNSTKDDYLLITGPANMSIIAASVFARKHGKLNLLLFCGGDYVERKLNVDALIK